MIKITGDESIYPLSYTDEDNELVIESGLTLRQDLSARFLQGLLAGRPTTSSSSMNMGYVETAVKYADALISELNKVADINN